MGNPGTLPIFLTAFCPTAPHWGTLPTLWAVPALGDGSGGLSSGWEVPAGLSVGPAAPKPHIQAGSTLLEPGKTLTKTLGASSAVGLQLLLCLIVGSPRHPKRHGADNNSLLQGLCVPSAPVLTPLSPITHHSPCTQNFSSLASVTTVPGGFSGTFLPSRL